MAKKLRRSNRVRTQKGSAVSALVPNPKPAKIQKRRQTLASKQSPKPINSDLVPHVEAKNISNVANKKTTSRTRSTTKILVDSGANNSRRVRAQKGSVVSPPVRKPKPAKIQKRRQTLDPKKSPTTILKQNSAMRSRSKSVSFDLPPRIDAKNNSNVVDKTVDSRPRSTTNTLINFGASTSTVPTTTNQLSLFGQPSTSTIGSFGLWSNTGASAFSSSQTINANGTAIAKFQTQLGTDREIKSNGQTYTVLTQQNCITAMQEYDDKCLEELRLEDYLANRKGPQANSFQSNGLFRSAQEQQNTKDTDVGLSSADVRSYEC